MTTRKQHLDDYVAAQERLAELTATFDLRWKADIRAIKRWQAAHPGNELTWPDHADLVVWLMEETIRLRAIEETARALERHGFLDLVSHTSEEGWEAATALRAALRGER
jgi:hypothetical protein